MNKFELNAFFKQNLIANKILKYKLSIFGGKLKFWKFQENLKKYELVFVEFPKRNEKNFARMLVGFSLFFVESFVSGKMALKFRQKN